MGFYDTDAYSKSRKPKPKTPMDISSYKSPLDREPDLVSVAVLNCDKHEADAIVEFARYVRNARGTVIPIAIQAVLNPPVQPENVMRAPSSYKSLPAGWTKRWNSEEMRAEFIAPDGKCYYDDGGILLEVPKPPVTTFYCEAGHCLDYPNQLCNLCGKRMQGSEDIFGDEEVMKQRDALQAKFDQERKERERIRAADPTGRFSGLEI